MKIPVFELLGSNGRAQDVEMLTLRGRRQAVVPLSCQVFTRWCCERGGVSSRLFRMLFFSSLLCNQVVTLLSLICKG